jgi:hypothetical protein
MPKPMRCPGCEETTIPTQIEGKQLNCRNCDRILVMPNGESAEPGTSFVKLPVNGTYLNRWASWRQVTRNLGLLVIEESRTAFSRAVFSRYAVLELEHDEGREFKLTKSGGEVVYYLLMPRADHPRCTCRGHEAGGYCKHVQALTALINKGYLKPQ